MEGDWGGQIYLACPLSVVGATEPALRALLRELDAIAWPTNDQEGMAILYEHRPAGAGVAGGMGGGLVDAAIWVHDEFVALGLADAIRAVIRGERERLR